jgi:hypothetical protein
MIRNRTKNTLVVTDFSQKKGLGKILGLIGKKNPKTVVFTTRFGIHTFLMNFAIDVLILDKNKKIVFMKKSLKPNRIFLWNPVYNIVVELPSGSIQQSKTQIGDIIEYRL